MINNMRDLESVYSQALSLALDKTMSRLLEELKNIIDATVYSYDNKWYDRTYETRDNWHALKSTIKGIMVESSILQSDLTFNMDDWQHGSYLSGGLSNDEMNEIITQGLSGNVANFPNMPERDYWGEFMEYVDEMIDVIFREEVMQTGLSIQFKLIY